MTIRGLHFSFVLWSLLALNSLVCASGAEKEKGKLILGLEQEIRKTMYEITRLESEAGKDLKDVRYIYPIASRDVFNLGLLLDLSKSKSNDFYKILAVTQGGVADNMGFKVGDRLKSINGIRITQGNYLEAYEFLSAFEGTELNVTLNRSGKLMNIASRIKPLSTPSATLVIGDIAKKDLNGIKTVVLATGCSSVSTKTAPPKDKRIKKVSITAIDGKKTAEKIQIFALPAGSHTISVSHFESTAKLLLSSSPLNRSKDIKVNFEENVRFHLGALLLENKVNTRRENDYWQPVVWRVTNDPIDECTQQSPLQEKSNLLLEELSGSIRTVIYDLALAKPEPKFRSKDHWLLIDIPAEKKVDLGVIVNLGESSPAEGLEVLSVSQNGLSAKIGLLPGDIIVSINGKNLVGKKVRDGYLMLLEQLSLPALTLGIVGANGEAREIETQLSELRLPSIKLFMAD